MTPEGITATYDALSGEVKAALELRRRLARRRSPAYTRWSVPAVPPNPTRPTHEGWRQELIDAATDEDRGNPLFSCVTATYWVEELANHLGSQFELNADRLSALRTIQELREHHLRTLPRWLSFTAVATALITVVGFVASQVPSETFGALGLCQMTTTAGTDSACLRCSSVYS